jgi:hypothetical protein
MKRHLFILVCCCALSLAVSTPVGVEVRAQTETKVVTLKGITEEAAISIAKKEARRRHQRIEGLRIIPCEQVGFWRIIFDGGGPEFVIDKRSGMVIRAQTIPQSATGNHATVGSGITKEQAIDIAKRDVRRTYAKYGMDPENFAVIVCEESKAWRVIFDFKLDPGPRSRYQLPNGKYPKYVIDKTSGDVIYRELN